MPDWTAVPIAALVVDLVLRPAMVTLEVPFRDRQVWPWTRKRRGEFIILGSAENDQVVESRSPKGGLSSTLSLNCSPLASSQLIASCMRLLTHVFEFGLKA